MHGRTIKIVMDRISELENSVDKCKMTGDPFSELSTLKDLLKFNEWLFRRLTAPMISRKIQ